MPPPPLPCFYFWRSQTLPPSDHCGQQCNGSVACDVLRNEEEKELCKPAEAAIHTALLFSKKMTIFSLSTLSKTIATSLCLSIAFIIIIIIFRTSSLSSEPPHPPPYTPRPPSCPHKPSGSRPSRTFVERHQAGNCIFRLIMEAPDLVVTICMRHVCFSQRPFLLIEDFSQLSWPRVGTCSCLACAGATTPSTVLLTAATFFPFSSSLPLFLPLHSLHAFTAIPCALQVKWRERLREGGKME